MRNAVLWATVATLFLVCVGIWSVVYERERPRVLTVSFLSVGQGDAILVQSPTGRRMLVDDGRDRAVLRELPRVMPWWDRTIDVVVATHPDADHVGGLFDVLERYRVSYIVESGVAHDTPQAESLLTAVSREVGSGAQRILAQRGQVIDMGGGSYVHILFPDRDVSGLETNTASIVMRVVYGETSFLLSGDSPIDIEQYLVALDGKKLQSTVLKAGHHGSRTSTSPTFVGYVSPEWGVFSRGCENEYGHPHQEVVDIFELFGVLTKDTCLDGTITFASDGVQVIAR
jgi:competence protein ComEC